MASSIRFRAAWRYLGFGWVALVAYLSLTPHPPGEGVLPTDPGHFVAYGCLMVWFGQLHAGARDRVSTAASLVGLGIAIELLQTLVPPRDCSLLDMATNAAGVAAGCLVLRTRIGSAMDAVEIAVRDAIRRAA
jgi:VanZ family protein